MISTYNQVCPVIFGRGAIGQLPEKVAELGGTKALCIYDQGVKQTGMAEKIVTSLRTAGIDVVTFDEVQPDAPDDMVNSVGRVAQDEKVNIVIGIGGGSTLDTAKAAAVLVENPLPVNRYFVSSGIAFSSVTPLILVPTSAGTGSEVTTMAVIHDHELHAKNGILRSANLAIVDPELTVTVPPQITAATGMDAMSHAIEAYTSTGANPMTDLLALEAIRLIAEYLERACKNGEDIDAREQLCFASNIAGTAFNTAMVHFGHAAAHELGIQMHIQHGAACALSIPEVIEFTADLIPQKTIKVAQALGIELCRDISGIEAGKIAADWVREFLKRLDVKSLSARGISREQAVACAESAVANNWFVACALKPVDASEMARLIGKMYDNYK